jgi:hypothetical protein
MMLLPEMRRDMTVGEDDIERRITEYIRETPMANRHNCIRDITGQIEILPSGVAKVITRMIDERKIRHLKSNDRLEFVD